MNKILRRGDFASASEAMIELLGELLDGHWVYTEPINKNTLKALVEREWIAISPANELDGERCRITLRGKKAYKIYTTKDYDTRRYDGICPSCNTRPRHRTKSGRLNGYCLKCERQYRRQRYTDRFSIQSRKCPSCEDGERFQYSSGRWSGYCRDCTNARHRKYQKRRRRELAKRIKAGEHVGCLNCGELVYYTDNIVSDYCRDCGNALRRRWYRKKGYQRVNEELGANDANR